MLHNWVQTGFFLLMMQDKEQSKQRPTSNNHRTIISPHHIGGLKINTEKTKQFALDYTRYDGCLTLQQYPFTDKMKQKLQEFQNYELKSDLESKTLQDRTRRPQGSSS